MFWREGNLLPKDTPFLLFFLPSDCSLYRMLFILFFLVRTFRDPLKFFIVLLYYCFCIFKSTEHTGKGFKNYDWRESSFSISDIVIFCLWMFIISTYIYDYCFSCLNLSLLSFYISWTYCYLYLSISLDVYWRRLLYLFICFVWYTLGSGEGYLTGLDLNWASRHLIEYLVRLKAERLLFWVEGVSL